VVEKFWRASIEDKVSVVVRTSRALRWTQTLEMCYFVLIGISDTRIN
jgi:hypothetical protein